MEFEYGLSPVVTELSQTDREDSACSALKLINRLIKFSPTTSFRIRIRHELQGCFSNYANLCSYRPPPIFELFNMTQTF